MTAGNLLRAGLLALLLALVLRPDWFAPLFAPLAPAGGPVIYARSSLLSLSLSHLGLVALASVAATLVAVTLAIFVTRPVGASFLPLSRTITNIGQTFPPVAVLALAVPALGFGAGPTLVALFLYGLLPIFENAITALSTLPPATMEAARGMGLNRWQRLWRVELPLALPVILTGLRIVLVQNIGLAVIAGLIGGGGFGTFVFQGLNQTATDLILLGALPTVALALTAAIVMDILVDLTRRLPKETP